MKTNCILFTFAWMQVALVAINTWQIANEKYLGAVIVGFLISLVWTSNVKRVAFSTMAERLIYCLGASAGTITGLVAARMLYK